MLKYTFNFCFNCEMYHLDNFKNPDLNSDYPVVCLNDREKEEAKTFPVYKKEKLYMPGVYDFYISPYEMKNFMKYLKEHNNDEPWFYTKESLKKDAFHA